MFDECGRIKGRLSEYIDERLGRDEASRMQTHLANCPACAAAARDLRGAVDLVRGAARMEPSDRFETGLQGKLMAFRPAEIGRESLWVLIGRRLRIARARRQNAGRLVFAATGTFVAAGIAAFLLTAQQPLSILSTHRAPRPIVRINEGAVPAADRAFIAACSSQRALYESAQPIADPTAEIVAARVDEAEAPAGAGGAE